MQKYSTWGCVIQCNIVYTSRTNAFLASKYPRKQNLSWFHFFECVFDGHFELHWPPYLAFLNNIMYPKIMKVRSFVLIVSTYICQNPQETSFDTHFLESKIAAKSKMAANLCAMVS